MRIFLYALPEVDFWIKCTKYGDMIYTWRDLLYLLVLNNIDRCSGFVAAFLDGKLQISVKSQCIIYKLTVTADKKRFGRGQDVNDGGRPRILRISRTGKSLPGIKGKRRLFEGAENERAGAEPTIKLWETLNF